MKRIGTISTIVILLCASHGNTQNQSAPSEYDHFSEIANCFVRTNASTEVWNSLMLGLAGRPAGTEILNIDAMGELVVTLDDERRDLANKLASIAEQNNWTEEQLIFRITASTAGFTAQMERYATSLRKETDLSNAFKLAGDLWIEAIACNAELLIDDLSK